MKRRGLLYLLKDQAIDELEIRLGLEEIDVGLPNKGAIRLRAPIDSPQWPHSPKIFPGCQHVHDRKCRRGKPVTNTTLEHRKINHMRPRALQVGVTGAHPASSDTDRRPPQLRHRQALIPTSFKREGFHRQGAWKFHCQQESHT